MSVNYLIFFRCILLLIVSFFSSYKINKLIINISLQENKGQEVSKYLMENHQEKKKTPTFGGVGIIISTLLSTLFICDSYLNIEFVVAIILLSSFFIIGSIDDFIKVFNKNYKGLSSIIRILLELVIVLIIYYLLKKNSIIDNIFYFNNSIYFNLGSMFIIGVIFLLVGSANAVNLTDGLDGLAGGLYLISLLPFALFLVKENNYDLLYLLMIIYGSITGFLVLNLHPAKIFMGDSGSLSLGVFLGYLSLICKKELLLIIIGGIFVFETLSVIFQVSIFKITKKRIFKMAPFHHHLEMMGKKEYTIVMLFYVIAFTLSLIGLIIGLIL